MSKTSKLLFCILCIVLLFGSCTDDDLGPCANLMPACDCAQFLLLDRWGNTLIGKDKMFHPDSLHILNDPQHWNLKFNDSLITFNYGLLSPNKEYYLKLSSKNIDTIKLDITSQQGECFTIKSISDFRYSGAKVSLDDNKVVIIKI